jgi:thymidylate kinase
VRLTVWFTGLSGAGKTTICKSVHAEFQAAEFQDNPREPAKCPIGWTARPEAAVRNWISACRAADAARSIACRMAYGKILLVGR